MFHLSFIMEQKKAFVGFLVVSHASTDQILLYIQLWLLFCPLAVFTQSK